jgi:hypothetical protein
LNYKLRDEVNVTGMKFEVSMAVSMKVAVFWDMTPCNLVETYKCFDRLAASIFTVKDGCSRLLQNVV